MPVVGREKLLAIKCDSWPSCGAAMVRQYLALQEDQRSDWIGTVCGNEAKYRECPHYKLGPDPKKKENQNETGEELAQEKKREIIVLAPYTFDPLTKILRKWGLLVKNSWLNIEPSQEEINSVIAAIEEAADMLKQKHF